ncbi:MAG: FecR family protein [Patescibacteria group bacterium]
MRKIITLSLSLAVVVVVGIVFLLNSRNKSPEETPGVSNTDVYSVAVLNPDVFLKLSPDDGFTFITGSVDIRAGAEIKTSAKGRAKILYPNGTITAIEGDSHIIIDTLDSGGGASRLQLVFGSIWSKIQNILGTSEYYEVETGNIIASVRGTIFALEYRNNTSKVYGIGNTVNVVARGPQQSTIPGTSVDVSSGERVTLTGTPRVTNSPLPKEQVSDADLNQTVISRNISEISDEELNSSWHKGLKELIKRVKKSPSPSSSTRTPTPSATASPRVSISPTPTPTPTPTPVPNINPLLESVFPRLIQLGQQFTVNGSNFINNQNIKQIKQVIIGTSSVQFTVIDSTTIFANPGSLPKGTYDITIISINDTRSSLSQALTIQ